MTFLTITAWLAPSVLAVLLQSSQASDRASRCSGRTRALLLPDMTTPAPLELRLDFSLWPSTALRHLEPFRWALGAGDVQRARVELGRSGADAQFYAVEELSLHVAQLAVRGMKPDAELRLLARRSLRKHQLDHCPDLPLANDGVTLRIPLLADPLPNPSTSSKSLGLFLSTAASANASAAAKGGVDLGKAARESSAMWGGGLHALVLKSTDAAGVGPCANWLDIVVAAAVSAAGMPAMMVNGSTLDEWVQPTSAARAEVIVGAFPKVGMFTKEQLAQRQLLFGGSMLAVVGSLVMFGLLAIAWKNGMLHRKGPSSPRPAAQGGAPAESAAAYAAIDEAEPAVVEEAVDHLVKARTQGSKYQAQRWVVSVLLYFGYVTGCILIPLGNWSAVSCYESVPWERHIPFLALFVAHKVWELCLCFCEPRAVGEITLCRPFFQSFFFMFSSSFFGYFDGYTDGNAIIVAQACGSGLWVPMACVFAVGVVFVQWVLMGTLAFMLDSTGKCFYKLMHMDVLAAAIPFENADPYAKPVWKAISWARFFAEDLPTTPVQIIFILKVRKNPMMILSVLISLGTAAYAAYNVAARNVRLALHDMPRPRVRGMLSMRVLAGYALPLSPDHDAYVQMRLKSQPESRAKRTSVSSERGDNPVWNTTPFLFPINQDDEEVDTLRLEVWQEGRLTTTNSLVGEMTIPVNHTITGTPNTAIRIRDNVSERGVLEVEVGFSPDVELEFSRD